MDDRTMHKEVVVGFEYSYLYDSWVNPLSEALDGLTVEQALWKPNPDSTCIWQIVLHLAVWNENIVERTHLRQATHPVEGAWPELPIHAGPEEWEAAQQRLWDSLTAIRSMLDAMSIDELQAGYYGLGDLFCRFTHMAYHLGQITKMREFAGW